MEISHLASELKALKLELSDDLIMHLVWQHRSFHHLQQEVWKVNDTQRQETVQHAMLKGGQVIEPLALQRTKLCN